MNEHSPIALPDGENHALTHDHTHSLDHNHHHEHHHHEHHHSHDHHHHHDACSCTHDGCSCGHSHDEKPFGLKDGLLLGGAVLLLILSLFWDSLLIKTLFCAGAVLLSGWELIFEGLKGLFRLSFTENTLMTIAVIAAFALGEAFEGAMVTLLFSVGEILEGSAVAKSRRRIDALIDLVPATAMVINDQGTFETNAKMVMVGDHILIRKGDRIPLDCMVTEGESEIDASALTGESLPRPVKAGDPLASGTINLGDRLIAKVTKDYENSSAPMIAKMVRESAEEKGKTERFITRFSRIYTPVVVIAAVLLAVSPPLLGFGSFLTWIKRSLIFLVASCPCALVISIPLTFYSALGSASRIGALLKGSDPIEQLAKVDTVFFDKTGTLTDGKLTVSQVLTLSDIKEDTILSLAAACESASNHPIAKAVCAAAASFTPAEKVIEFPGKGLSAKIDGISYLCGSETFLKEEGISTDALPAANLYLVKEKTVIGALRLGDQSRREAKEMLSKLKQLGIRKTVLLSGDRKETVEAFAKELSLDEGIGALLPADKADILSKAQESGAVTCFVGDGINDGPVLAKASVGAAMGEGSDLAAQTADVILLNNDLLALPRAIRLSRKRRKLVWENLLFIFGVKALVLILGALGYAPIYAAVFADVGVTLITVVNALRAMR